ncbi:hypothetical protein GQ54DRAFT_153826 [Martensiomyces pterosporus]|nr:hypothetical protein GQ54DRAFT_153826 [Martensiomyces pterosporus]
MRSIPVHTGPSEAPPGIAHRADTGSSASSKANAASSSSGRFSGWLSIVAAVLVAAGFPRYAIRCW